MNRNKVRVCTFARFDVPVLAVAQRGLKGGSHFANAEQRQARLLLTFTSVCSQHPFPQFHHPNQDHPPSPPSASLKHRKRSHLNGDNNFSTTTAPGLKTSASRHRQPAVTRKKCSFDNTIWRSKRRTSLSYPYPTVSRIRSVKLDFSPQYHLKYSRFGKYERRATKMLQRHLRQPRMNHTQPSNLLYLTLDYGEALSSTQM